MWRCDSCRFYHAYKTRVPYGEGSTSIESWECANGYDRGDCPEEMYAPDDEIEVAGHIMRVTSPYDCDYDDV
jgi:hypothetical protein